MRAKGVLGVILSEYRDPRFVTIRRGGTLTDSDHQLLTLWAASCAEHVLDLFESAQPEDRRPRQAIEQARAWARGEVTMTPARTAAGHVKRRGQRPTWGSTACRVRCRPGRGRRTRRRARARCGRLCDQGRTCCRAGRRGRERRATRVPVAARPAPGGDSRARTRRRAVAQRHLLVGVRLLRKLSIVETRDCWCSRGLSSCDFTPLPALTDTASGLRLVSGRCTLSSCGGEKTRYCTDQRPSP